MADQNSPPVCLYCRAQLRWSVIWGDWVHIIGSSRHCNVAGAFGKLAIPIPKDSE